MDVENLEIVPAEVAVSLREYKKQFLDILDLIIHFSDGTETPVDYPDIQFGIVEYYETPDAFQESNSKWVVQYLEGLGYKGLDPSMVYFQVDEVVPDTFD